MTTKMRTPRMYVDSKIYACVSGNGWQKLFVPLRAGREASRVNALKDDARVSGFMHILLSNYRSKYSKSDKEYENALKRACHLLHPRCKRMQHLFRQRKAQLPDAADVHPRVERTRQQTMNSGGPC